MSLLYLPLSQLRLHPQNIRTYYPPADALETTEVAA